jgi:hypothetical protein
LKLRQSSRARRHNDAPFSFMSKLRTNPSIPADRASDHAADQPTDRGKPLPDALTQIRDARDRIVAAVIERAEKDGSYQHAKWLFEFGGIVPAGHSAPEDETSLLRSLLETLQIPETPEEIAAEFAAQDHAVE